MSGAAMTVALAVLVAVFGSVVLAMLTRGSAVVQLKLSTLM
jgi:hypothetical protein